jgi:hypothetical protein
MRVSFQFHNPRFDSLSVRVTPVELISNGAVFGHGTGFVWKTEEKHYLITNWHNLAGQNPFNGTHLNVGGRTPDKVRIYPAILSDLEGGRKQIVREQIELTLFQDFHKPFWLQHQFFSDLKIDIAVLELPNEKKEYEAINTVSYQKLYTHVGSDVFIVGYPFSEFDEIKFPLWKKGSLASEPLSGWNRKPAFLIDAASRPGMSGSPVFRRVYGPAAVSTGNGDELTINLDSVVASEFVGVYAGHLSVKNESVTIGYAWYASLIAEIIDNPAPGSRL